MPDYPEHWSLEDFPDPNPYFPKTPRLQISRQLTFWAALTFFGLISSFGAVVFLVTRERLENHWPWLFVVFGGFIAAARTWRTVSYLRAIRPWAEGKIVPAVVVVSPSLPLQAYDWLRLNPLLKLIGALVAHSMRRSRAIHNNATVEYIDGGEVHRAAFLTEDWWQHFPVNRVLWIAIEKRTVSPLEFVAPKTVSDIEVPEEAEHWLSAAMRRARSE